MDGSDLMTPILELKNIDYSYHTLDGETKALSNIPVQYFIFTYERGVYGRCRTFWMRQIDSALPDRRSDEAGEWRPADERGIFNRKFIKDRIYAPARSSL